MARSPAPAVPDKTQTSLDVVLRCFVGALSADSGILLGFDGGSKVELLSASGHAARHATVPWTRGSFLGQALKTEGASLEPASGWNENSGTPDAWHAVACRISGPDGSLGAIYAGFARPSRMSRFELSWIANAHARLAGLCMTDGGGEVASVLRSSGIDQLTRCLTYERVLEMLRSEIQRSARQRHKLSCCFFDIDHFKAINDEHGHLMGNRVLTSTGVALRRVARDYDCVGRFGGDEFLVVLPETTLEDARSAANRMRASVQDAVRRETGLEVTASAGIAEWRQDNSMLQLLEASDRALQTAKANGGAEVHSGALPRRRFAELMRRTEQDR